MDKLFLNFKQKIKKYNLIRRKDRILIAFSGGPDSQCLLSLLSQIQELYCIEIGLAHVSYRSEITRDEKDKEAEMIRLLASKKNIPIHQIKVNNTTIVGLQNRARNIRFKFFVSLIKKYHYTKLAIGHHLDDQIETFLFKILNKASYKKGLLGIAIKRQFKNICIIRPLIFFSKENIIDYLKAKKISYLLDPTNIRPIYSRNKIRLEILPKIKDFFPNFERNILSWIKKFREEENYFDSLLKKILKEILFFKSKNEIFIQISEWEKLDIAIKKRAIYKISNYISSRYIFFQEKCFKNIFKIFKKRKRNYITLFQNGDFYITIENEFLVFFREKMINPLEEKVILDKKNDSKFVLEIPFLHHKLYVSYTHIKDLNDLYQNKDSVFYINVAKIKDLKIRLANKYIFFNLENGHKRRIWDILQEKKIPPRKRKETIILFSGEDIVAFFSKNPYPYIRVAKKYYIYSNQQEVLKIRLT